MSRLVNVHYILHDCVEKTYASSTLDIIALFDVVACNFPCCRIQGFDVVVCLCCKCTGCFLLLTFNMLTFFGVIMFVK